MSFQTNEKGELLLNIEDVIKDLIGIGYSYTGFSRYNGGWIKRVTGLNKQKTDGYSILGDFAQSKKTWVKPGLYLDCSIDGTRNNPENRLHLVILSNDGSVKQVGEEIITKNRDWAVELWDDIENILRNRNFTTVAEKTRLDILKEEEKKLIEQLEAIRAEIETLEK